MTWGETPMNTLLKITKPQLS